MVKEKNLVLLIVLSMVTCGIYGIIWFIQLTNDVVEASDGKEYNTSGGMAFVLSLITCGIYSYYWAYKMGQSIGLVKAKTSNSTGDDGIIYLILSVFGLTIVAYILAQIELNKFATSGNAKAINA